MVELLTKGLIKSIVKKRLFKLINKNWMRKYELSIVMIAVFKTVSFIRNTITFEAESIEGALSKAKEILKEEKKKISDELNGLVEGKNPLIQISIAQKEELMSEYPTQFELVETVTHIISTESE